MLFPKKILSTDYFTYEHFKVHLVQSKQRMSFAVKLIIHTSQPIIIL